MRPSRNDFSHLEISSMKLPNDFDFQKHSSMISESILKHNNNNNATSIIDLKKRNKINHIDFRKFTDFEYFTNNSKESNQVFLNVSYSNSKLKTILLDKSNDEMLNIKKLYKIEFENEKIIGLAGSELIKGECAVVTNNNIYLTSEHLKNYNVKVASDIDPLFKSDIKCKCVSFGNNPRHLIYTDYSQVLNIDSRVKTNKNKHILKLPCKYLDKNELIFRSKKLENDYNCHLICCSNSVIVIDERFNNYPLLKWKHNIKSSINLLETFSINLDTYETNFCIFSDSRNVFSNQFSLKLNNVPISQNFPIKLDSPSDYYKDLSELSFHNKVLNRVLNHRSQKPILSLSHVKKGNSFALFQVFSIYNVS
jgi:hypothetical protein